MVRCKWCGTRLIRDDAAVVHDENLCELSILRELRNRLIEYGKGAPFSIMSLVHEARTLANRGEGI
jgi:hypothetical protein